MPNPPHPSGPPPCHSLRQGACRSRAQGEGCSIPCSAAYQGPRRGHRIALYRHADFLHMLRLHKVTIMQPGPAVQTTCDLYRDTGGTGQRLKGKGLGSSEMDEPAKQTQGVQCQQPPTSLKLNFDASCRCWPSRGRLGPSQSCCHCCIGFSAPRPEGDIASSLPHPPCQHWEHRRTGGYRSPFLR